MLDPAAVNALLLASGTSLDPGVCAYAFLAAFADLLDLGGAAIYARRAAAGEPGPPTDLRQLATVGAAVPVDMADVQAAQERDRPTVEATVGMVPLRGVGVLAFHRTAPLAPGTLEALESVLDKQAVGLQGAFAHYRLQRQAGEREEAEAEQRLNAERLAALIRRSPAAILVEDAERRVRLANAAFCTLFGIDAPPEALEGADCAEAARATASLFAEAEPFLDRVTDLLAARETVTGEEIRLADGRVVERDYIPILLDGEHLGHLWEYRDVTARYRHAEEVDALRQFYERVLGAMPAQLAVFDPDGRYRYATPSAIRDPGRRAAVIGKTDAEYAQMRGLPDEVPRRRLETIREVARSQQAIRFEESFENREGERRHFVRFVSPVVGEEGQTVQVLGYGLDITDRKQAEEALRQSEALKRGLFESALDAVITVDQESHVLEFNPAAERIFGHRAADVVGEEMADLIVPARLRSAHAAGMKHYLATGEGPVLGRRIVVPALRSDGSEFPAELAINSVRLDGEREVFTATLRDISEQQAAEDALRKSEARLRLALDAADLGTWDRTIAGADGRGEGDWDARCRAIFGLSPEGTLTFADVRARIHPDDRERVDTLLAKAYAPASDGVYEAEYRVVWPSGEVRWVSAHGLVIFEDDGEDRRAVRFVGTAQDVTAARRAAEALAESEGRYKQIVENSQDLIYRADLEGRFTFVNAVAAYRTGYDADALLGMSFWELVPEAHRGDVIRFYADQLAGGRPTSYRELPIQSAEGGTIWIGQNVQLLEEDGEPVGVQAVARDVTERRRVMDELVAAREAAEQASRAREEFLANMSHEMRTPLNAVLGLGELLRQSGLEDEQRRFVDALSFSADQLLALINDLLDVAKIESGQIVFEQVPFRLREVVSGALETIRFRAEEKGLDLVLDVDDALPDVLVGDPVRLSQILLNLLSNAVKFTPHGRVMLSAERAESASGETRVRLVVEDTGIGIPKAKLASIFERFTQARSDTTRRFGGTGLGLAIVKELTERQDGEIRVESEEGEGTRFVVTLAFGQTDLAPELVLDDDADLSGAKLLVVEDNALNQLVAERMLTGWGAEVEVAGGGAAGLDALDAAHADGRPFDLVLMDIQMPEMDGFETTRRIRERYASAELPVLALTASALLEQRGQMEAAGMDGLVLKPFKPAHLRRAVAAHLGRTEAPSEPAAAPDSPAIVDLKELETSLGGDHAFIVHLIDLFGGVAADAVSDMEAALDAGDPRALSAAAHKLKSSAGLLGLGPLHAALAQLEKEADALADASASPEPLAPLVVRVSEHARAAGDELLRLRPHYQADSR